MSLVINLSSQLERRLQAAASRQHMQPEELAASVLEQHIAPLPPEKSPQEAVRVLAQWRADHAHEPDVDEHDFDQVLKNIDAGRSSYRQLFPDDLKGVTW